MSKYTKHVPRIMGSVLNYPQGIQMCVLFFHLLCGRSICWKKHDLQGQIALGSLSKILLQTEVRQMQYKSEFSHLDFILIFSHFYYSWKGFPGGSVSKKKKKSACQCRRLGFDPWVRKIPWTRKWQSTPVFLPGKFHEHEQRSLPGYSSWGSQKSWT